MIKLNNNIDNRVCYKSFSDSFNISDSALLFFKILSLLSLSFYTSASRSQCIVLKFLTSSHFLSYFSDLFSL